MADVSMGFPRRRFLQLLIAVPAAWFAGLRVLGRDDHAAAAALLAASAPDSAAARGGRGLAPTPDCDDGDEPTPSETEGPFFTPRSPERTSLLERGMPGTRIVLTGRVLSPGCKPLAGALLDFWHADDSGEYDNQGYRCRGHQFTDADGRYRLETVVPGLYPGRTRHFHVKVQPKGGRVLTTQLYFPGEARNQRDFLFRPDLLMAIDPAAKSQPARFNFILRPA
jgi:protocatechuate 3,4-dioxygenase beta subunit